MACLDFARVLSQSARVSFGSAMIGRDDLLRMALEMEPGCAEAIAGLALGVVASAGDIRPLLPGLAEVWRLRELYDMATYVLVAEACQLVELTNGRSCSEYKVCLYRMEELGRKAHRLVCGHADRHQLLDCPVAGHPNRLL